MSSFCAPGAGLLSRGSCLLVLRFFAVMATSAWRQLLLDAAVADEVIAILSELGYSSNASFAFESEAVFKAFAKHALVTKGLMAGVTETAWVFRPLVGVLRHVWKQCLPSAASALAAATAPPTSALALPAPSTLRVGDPGVPAGSKLNVSQHAAIWKPNIRGCV